MNRIERVRETLCLLNDLLNATLMCSYVSLRETQITYYCITHNNSGLTLTMGQELRA